MDHQTAVNVVNSGGGIVLDSPHLWYLGLFCAVFAVSLSMDILTHRKHKVPTVTNALTWTVIWIAVSMAFAWVTWMLLGRDKAELYFTGWLMEKTLAVDNLFAFMAVFASFGLAAGNSAFQHRILHWGIIGAIGIRFVLLFFIGLLLSLTGIWHTLVMLALAGAVLAMAIALTKDAFKGDDSKEVDYANHWSVRFTKRFFPVEPSLAKGHFFVHKVIDGKKRWAVTVPFLCLVCIEMVDVGFAFDSMPAIAAVVQDPVIMFTATMMAVAGLRALYFALLTASNKLCHLDKAVAGLLFYVAGKVACDAFHLFHVSTMINMLIIVGFLGIGFLASFIWPEKPKEEKHDTPDGGVHKPVANPALPPSDGNGALRTGDGVHFCRPPTTLDATAAAIGEYHRLHGC